MSCADKTPAFFRHAAKSFHSDDRKNRGDNLSRYSTITTIETRRFSVRPVRVLLDATGTRLPSPRT